MAELVGTLVAGKYRVKRRIGAGGMGAVYEGEHVDIGKRVAIKVIEHEHARSSELAARFRREARAASAVESEHIVHVFDVGHDETVGLYMVMELLSGEDLAARLERNDGKLPVEEAVGIGMQAARALAKAHAAGVVHRDLKPANLFLTSREDGSVCVKILDFGISKLSRPDGGPSTTGAGNLTREGSVMGTPMYMSPEQAQGLAVDARADLWSLGAVLYEALSGRTAFEHRDTYEQMIVQIVTRRPKPLREAAPWVPDAIASVVECTLAHDVADRPESAAAFARQLADAAKMPRAGGSDPTVLADVRTSGPISSSDVAVAVPPATSSARGAASAPTGTGVVVGARTQLDAGIPPRKSPLAWIAAAGIALVVIVGIAVVATRDGTKATTASAGLVSPPPEPSAGRAPANGASDVAPATATAGGAAPTILPIDTAPAAPPAPVASASASAKPAVLTVRPGARPGNAAPPPAATNGKPPPPTTQYGAAGVSTAY